MSFRMFHRLAVSCALTVGLSGLLLYAGAQVNYPADAPTNPNFVPGPRKFPFHVKSVKANGVEFVYSDFGGTGEPLVFLNGLGGNAKTFVNFAPLFTDRYHVISMSRRGEGLSGYTSLPQDYTVEARVADDRAFLDAIGIQGKINLAGWSIAGSEITRFAVQYPSRVEKLVYLESAFGYGTAAFKQVRDQVVALFDNASDGTQVALAGPYPTTDQSRTVESLNSFYQKNYPYLYGRLDAEQAADYTVNAFVTTPTGGMVLDPDGFPIATVPPEPSGNVLSESDKYDTTKDWDKLQCPVLILSSDRTNFAAENPNLFAEVPWFLTPLEAAIENSPFAAASWPQMVPRNQFLRAFDEKFRKYGLQSKKDSRYGTSIWTGTTAQDRAEARRILIKSAELWITYAKQMDALFKSKHPDTQVLFIPNSTHYVTLTNAPDTYRATRKFLDNR